MPEKEPIVQSIVIALAAGALGCVARWFENVKVGGKFKMGVFLADLFISCGVGCAVFWLAIDFGQQLSVAACLSGVAGNYGSRIFDLARVLIGNRYSLPIDKDQTKHESK